MRASQPAPAPRAAPQSSPSKQLSTAEGLKEQGNAALKQGNLQQVKPRTCQHALACLSQLHHSFCHNCLYGVFITCMSVALVDLTYVANYCSMPLVMVS